MSNKYNHKYNPRPHDRTAIEFLLTHQHAGLLLVPGLGKTAITLYSFKFLKDLGELDKMFIIAPLRVCHLVWPREAAKWEQFRGLSVGVLHGKDKEQVLSEDHDIYVINPEGLRWFMGYAKNFFKSGKWMLTCDESTLFKNSRSQRFKNVKKLLGWFTKRLILTGTPAPNGLINLWSQMYILDKGEALGKFVTQFRNKYFYPSGFMGYAYKLQPGGDKAIYSATKENLLYMGAEHLDLPELTHNYMPVELPVAARKIYAAMKDEFITGLPDGGKSVAVNGAVVYGKLRQIANGGVYDEEGKAVLIHNAKTAALQELVDSLDGTPLMVFYEFNHDLKRLREVYPDAPHLGSGVSTSATADIQDKWNNNEIPLLLLHPAAAGHGLNLQESDCRAICWYSIPWDLEYYDQAIKRVHRSGVGNAVVCHHLVAEDTIDEKIVKVLAGKGSVQQALLNELKK